SLRKLEIIHHQRCKGCNRLSWPRLDETYIERAVTSIKNWHRVEQEIPPHSESSNGPQNSELCEGCRHRHCRAE
ncbi:hypothetical protein DPV78_000151, partial [Talaromyces pinophilus]